jgi:hypothetical protein
VRTPRGPEMLEIVEIAYPTPEVRRILRGT